VQLARARRPELVHNRWRGRTPLRRWAKRGLLWSFAGALLVTGLVALYSFATGEQHEPLTTLDEQCREGSGYSCNVFTNLLFTAAPLSLGFAVFLLWRYRRIPRPYVHKAREDPVALVDTAGSIVGDIIGRDDLCDVIQTELRDEHVRRPHVLVGGLGIGKTAVLVQLMRLLARRGAVPVAVRLRDVRGEIDFLELARQRFLEVVGRNLRSTAEGDRVWKQLVKDDRVVVLADGLEEAFADEDAGLARHHRVRVAVHHARERRFPLVIASRPHEALRALDAALVHVEPLSEEAALEYIESSDPDPAEPTIEEVVELAEVTDTPFYLQIARELHDHDQLEGNVDIGADRVTLRAQLVELWIEALVTKKLHRTQRVPLDEAGRRAAIAHLSALALVGLRDDTQQVLFAGWDGAHGGDAGGDPRRRHHAELTKVLHDELERRIKEIYVDQDQGTPADERSAPIVDVQAAASKGLRLGLVEPLTNGVRFPHSIMQAYLGARALQSLMDHDSGRGGPKLWEEYFKYGLGEGDVAEGGRELLLAIVLYSRMEPQDPGASDRWLTSLENLRTTLLTRLERKSVQDEAKRLDILSAVIELDTELRVRNREVDDVYLADASSGKAAERASTWAKIRTDDDSTRDAKARLIARLGEAARRLSGVRALGSSGESVYRCLYEICLQEGSYPLRLAAAQEIGSGGDAAWQALRARFEEEDVYLLQWREKVDTEVDEKAEEIQRSCAVKAWLLPMLIDSVSDRVRRDVDKILRQWIRCVEPETPSDPPSMPLSIEAALAQGFKHAANRRPHHAHESSESRAILQGHANYMIFRARFWYTRLTLLHALSLWELGRLVYPDRFEDESAERPHDARSLVARWLRRPHTGEEQHPFVLEAAELAVHALDSRQPARWLWIDESGVVTKVGSRPKRQEAEGRRSLWIARSAGWIALEPRARQLVADVLILLNLAERGDTARLREERLAKSNTDRLPLCLTEERCPHLKPSQTVGKADIPYPGQDCKAHCPVLLCPYPPRGQQPYRVELSEAFCRRQQVRQSVRTRIQPRHWQQGSRAEERRFWSEMEERARKG
jgi:hypothetical protein